MNIDDKTIDHLANLSKLEFNSEEKTAIKKDLEKMLDFIGKLDEIDTSGVEPLLFMTDEVNVLREDDAVDSISQEEALKNAPKKDTDYFRVPKVLEK